MKQIRRLVFVSLSELIDNDLEGLLDILEELVLSDYEEEERYNHVIEDMTYKAVDILDGMIGIEVQGNDIFI